jgi:nucleoid DNA-binding protein
MAKKKTKKKTAKKTAKKKAARKPAGKAKAAAKSTPTKVGALSPASKVRTKGEVYRVLSEQTGVSRKDVAAIFDTMKEMVGKDLSKRGPGVFSVPGMMKVTVKRMPATKARKGINPFTKEPTVFKAKPARNVVKVRPLKALKEMV